MNNNRTVPTCILIFLLLFGALVVLALLPTVKNVITQFDWAQTSCFVEVSEVAEASTSPKIKVQYRYAVEGKEYRGEQYELPTNVSRDGSYLEEIVATLAPGTTVPCWYDSDNPAEAVLEKASKGECFFLLFPAILFAIAYFGLRALWLPKRETEINDPLKTELNVDNKYAWAPYAFFSLFIIVGLGLTYLFFWARYDAIAQSKGWVESACELQLAEVENTTSTDSDGGSSTSYSPSVRYAYSFGGNNYIGTTFNPAELSYDSYSDVSELLEGLTVGEKTECYLNPDNPFESTLNRDMPMEVWFGLFPLIFAFAGLFGVFFLASNSRSAFTVISSGRVKYNHRSRLGGLIGVILTNIVWNGLVFGIGYVMWYDDGFSTENIFPFLILTPFALIGILLLFSIPVAFLQLFNPSLELEFSEHAPKPDGSFFVSWKLPTGTSRVNSLHIALELMSIGVETETKDEETQDSSASQKTRLSLDVIRTERSIEIESGSAYVEIPSQEEIDRYTEGDIASWRLMYRLDIPAYPDVVEYITLASS